jgi:hypothetical protein
MALSGNYMDGFPVSAIADPDGGLIVWNVSPSNYSYAAYV